MANTTVLNLPSSNYNWYVAISGASSAGSGASIVITFTGTWANSALPLVGTYVSVQGGTGTSAPNNGTWLVTAGGVNTISLAIPTVGVALYAGPPYWSSPYRYAAWGSGISGVLGGAKCLFSQTSDIGQMVWVTNAKTLSSIVGNGTIWTGTTSAPHGFRKGQIVSVGSTVDFNGDYVLASASGTTFTIALTTNSGTTDNAGGQTATINAYSYAGDYMPVNALTLNGITTTALTSKVYTPGATGAGAIWSSGTTYAIGDVVWYNDGSGHYGTFISVHVTNLNNIPNAATVGSHGNSAGGTYWAVWNYEVWQSTDTGSPAPTPYYVRVEYGTNNSVTSCPSLAFQFSNADSSTLTGDIYAPSVAATGNCTNREIVLINASCTDGGATLFECDFCGDTTNSGVCAFMWRNATTTVSACFFGWERSWANNGTQINTYITYVVGGGPSNSGTSTWKQCSLFLSGAPSMGIRSFGVCDAGWTGANSVAAPGSAAHSSAVGNNIPAQPVFPLVGWCGNPLLMLVAVNPLDIAEGGQFSIYNYGAPHTYLATLGVSGASVASWATQFGTDIGSTSGASGWPIPAMRWE
jgi:hypothetical protein